MQSYQAEGAQLKHNNGPHNMGSYPDHSTALPGKQRRGTINMGTSAFILRKLRSSTVSSFVQCFILNLSILYV